MTVCAAMGCTGICAAPHSSLCCTLRLPITVGSCKCCQPPCGCLLFCWLPCTLPPRIVSHAAEAKFSDAERMPDTVTATTRAETDLKLIAFSTVPEAGLQLLLWGLHYSIITCTCQASGPSQLTPRPSPSVHAWHMLATHAHRPACSIFPPGKVRSPELQQPGLPVPSREPCPLQDIYLSKALHPTCLYCLKQ